MLRTILLELFLPFSPFKKTANIRWTTISAQTLNSLENKTKWRVAPKRKTGPAAKHLLKGQPSLTSVERPSFYLRWDFVNVVRHARLTCDCFESSTLICLMIGRCVWRSCLPFSIIPRLIQPKRCHCIHLAEWRFNVSPRSSLLAHREGPFSGCYWVKSLEWPWMYSFCLL